MDRLAPPAYLTRLRAPVADESSSSAEYGIDDIIAERPPIDVVRDYFRFAVEGLE